MYYLIEQDGGQLWVGVENEWREVSQCDDIFADVCSALSERDALPWAELWPAEGRPEGVTVASWVSGEVTMLAEPGPYARVLLGPDYQPLRSLESIVNDWEAWAERIDPAGVYTAEQWGEMTPAERLGIAQAVFGG